MSLLLLSILVLLSSPARLPAQKLMADGVQDLATQIAAKVQQEQKRKIAVLPFRELDGKATVLGTYLAEDLVTHLFNLGSFDIVERTMLDRLLGEIKLGQSGLIDPETAKEVGKIAGVDAVVTGTITDLQSYVAVNCRLIDSATGRVFAAAQVRIVKDDDVRKIMDVPMPGTKAGGLSAGEPDSKTAQGQGTQGTQERQEQDFTFALKGCFRSGSMIRCHLLITNNANDRQLQIHMGRGTRLFDEFGNEWLASAVSLGSNSGSGGGYIGLLLTSGVPVRAEIRFDGVGSEAKVATLVEIDCYSQQSVRVQFRDVPIVDK